MIPSWGMVSGAEGCSPLGEGAAAGAAPGDVLDMDGSAVASPAVEDGAGQFVPGYGDFRVGHASIYHAHILALFRPNLHSC